MWQRLASRLFPVIALALLAGFSGGPADEVLRYRGEYTYGHEVRVFCPAINSQCYWIGAQATDAVRTTLKELATASGGTPYSAVCLVIEGRIDRDTKRDGFAADYDGLISISRVFGRCDETDIVTQGDLQHHRWLLESINNKPLDPATPQGMIPVLDFGARMSVTGNTGCNRFWGQAVLREGFFVIERMGSTRRVCASKRYDIERTVQQVFSSESFVTIGGDRQLILESGQAVLRFRLSDWLK